MWIGGAKDAGEWKWVDGQYVPLSKDAGGVWADNGGDGPAGNGNCLQIGWQGAAWDDVYCSGNKKYACEVSSCPFCEA